MIEGDAKRLIQAAVNQEVSDIHILPTKKAYAIHFRTNGRLSLYEEKSIDWGKRLISHFKYLANMDVGEKRRPQSGSTALMIEEENVELRFSTITNVLLYESIVIRVLKAQKRSNNQVITYFPEDIDLLRTLTQRKSGLILFSGPVGSGKTTTIYQLLRELIQQESLQIITMEDPVEIFEEQFLQTEVNEKAGITYDLLIKSSLRHHPDVLMIGEIRDEETARMAVRGALTGHLMIATIHAKNTLGVIARLQELSISDEQLRQTLIGVISQRLVPRYCYQCQSACRLDCQDKKQNQKRAAIFEILAKDSLNSVLHNNHTYIEYDSLNDKLRKAWAYGYIDEATYTKFEII
ncbi:Flp pilus assembly complex ATPase component TadA [Aerococcaceae bacterium DSM 111021]|nr:Flp pilus assembly complex ATPase component TadA [Aerococcaceae bacterium DSM 111021]